MNVRDLKKFASVAVNVGVNLQKGQDAVVFVSARNYELGELIAEVCYKRGARKVSIEFSDEEFSKLKYQYESLETLKEMKEWEILKYKDRSEICPCLIYVEDDDPDAFNMLDMKKIFTSRIERNKKVKVYRDRESLYNQWTIIAIPSKNWAKKVFPNEKNAEKKLLKAIMSATRLDNRNPSLVWEKHIESLNKKASTLNRLNLDYLVYSSSNGTKLKIKLQHNHCWLSARSKSLNNIEYCANLPTEEVFTMPDKYGAEGIVYSTKPLSYNGKVIDDFSLKFEKGKIVEIEARTNEEVLKEAIYTDEGSCYLGEVALVPFNSPINESGLLFYNTLFDENASCHLAFGEAYKDTIRGYENMNEEDFKRINYNESVVHVDFMIGSNDLDIVGYDFNGKAHQIFKNGIWAI